MITAQDIETELMSMIQDGLVRVCKTDTGETAYYLTRAAKKARRARLAGIREGNGHKAEEAVSS